ncbi:MAG: hypothetical protein QM776_08775 [Rhodocyclaceae bacterium]
MKRHPLLILLLVLLLIAQTSTSLADGMPRVAAGDASPALAACHTDQSSKTPISIATCHGDLACCQMPAVTPAFAAQPLPRAEPPRHAHAVVLTLGPGIQPDLRPPRA